MYYVYILRSIKFPNQYYTGATSDLEARLQKHNKGDVPHTSKFTPWEFDSFFSFRTEERALSFERYLKTGSGREFARRHFR
ncbi:MAG: GIY-YIG nuclease family protein [bacterium]